MNPLLMTSDLNTMIPALMAGADAHLFIISPYIKLNQLMQSLLEQKRAEAVPVKILCRKRPDEMPFFASLKNVDIRVQDNLHGKAYFSERDAIISSINMTELGESKNIEFGIYISETAEPERFKDLSDNLMEYFFSGVKTEALPNESILIPTRNKPQGFCIRCRTPIPFEINRPLCPECYASWIKYKNANFKERYCHSCGGINICGNFSRPLCWFCYSSSSNDRNLRI